MGSLLALGLPTSATAAIMLAAFQQYGMQPGPLLFVRNGELVWALLASLFIGMIVLLVINLPFAPLWAKLLMIPKPYLYAGITVFSALGVYASSGSIFDVAMLTVIGLLGFALRRFGLPLAPVLIAVILGPLAETSLRRTLAISEGDRRSAVLLRVDHHALLPAATRPGVGGDLPPAQPRTGGHLTSRSLESRGQRKTACRGYSASSAGGAGIRPEPSGTGTAASSAWV